MLKVQKIGPGTWRWFTCIWIDGKTVGMYVCMSVSVCAYMCMCMHTCMHVFVCMWVFKCVCVCICCVCMCVWMHVCVCMHVCLLLCVCVHACIYACVLCVCVCMHVCVCIYVIHNQSSHQICICKKRTKSNTIPGSKHPYPKILHEKFFTPNQPNLSRDTYQYLSWSMHTLVHTFKGLVKCADVKKNVQHYP